MPLELASMGSTVAELFRDWIGIFAAPLKNIDMLWILIPVYVGWAFTEFYQEKKGTNLGNAITNGAIPLLVGFDWARQVVSQALASRAFDHIFYSKVAIAMLAFSYGLFVIYHGIKAKSKVKIFGRIRIVTYVVLVLTPIFYGAVEPSLRLLAAVLLFFPLYYVVIEIIDFIIPDPKSIKEEEASPTTPGDQYYYSPQYPNYQYPPGYPPGYQQYNPYGGRYAQQIQQSQPFSPMNQQRR